MIPMYNMLMSVAAEFRRKNTHHCPHLGATLRQMEKLLMRLVCSSQAL